MRSALQHRARVQIDGKGLRYKFVLDLIPGGLRLGDPRGFQPLGGTWRKKVKGLRRDRDKVNKETEHCKESTRLLKRKAFAHESLYNEMITRRQQRAVIPLSDLSRQFHLRNGEQFREELKASRARWLKDLQEQQRRNGLASEPLMRSSVLIGRQQAPQL